MGVKRADKRKPDETRDAMWKAIRDRAEGFTAYDIFINSGCSNDAVREYLVSLTRGGYIEEAGTGRNPSTGRPAMRYKLVRDVGRHAPRVRRDGSPVTMGLGRLNMWRAIRSISMNGDFSPLDLAFQASNELHQVSPEEAATYIGYLHKAGYLRITRQSKPGSPTTAGHQARYRLIESQYSGPLPPQIQRIRQVWDPNTKTVKWSGEES